MPAYNFQRRFAPMIVSGRKKHTIRGKRTHPAKPGDTLFLYTGLRTKRAKRIIPPVECVKVQNIRISTDGIVVQVFIDGIELSRDERETLAFADGFENFREMLDFWDGRLPFEGEIIHWK